MCLGRLGNKGQLLLNSKVTEFYLKHNQPQYKHVIQMDGQGQQKSQMKFREKKPQNNKPQQNKSSLE